jgi:hypothetical protein
MPKLKVFIYHGRGYDDMSHLMMSISDLLSSQLVAFKLDGATIADVALIAALQKFSQSLLILGFANLHVCAGSWRNVLGMVTHRLPSLKLAKFANLTQAHHRIS